jgi:rhomboid family GlyGly-CTERM serine protease
MTGSRQSEVLARWALPLGLAAAAVTLQATGGPDLWRLERGLTLAEPWRLVTGQLVHLGWAHLLMNLTGLAVLWALLAPAMALRHWALVTLTSGAGVNLGLLLFSPAVAWYAGLSGILHGLLVAGALAGLKRTPGTAAVLLALLVVKLGMEQFTGEDVATARLIGGAVIVDAHLYGALSGALCTALLRLAARAPGSRTSKPSQ